jgi:hypothetical protein
MTALLVTLLSLSLGDELSECRRLAPKYAAKVEEVMPDGSRCDLLSAEYAIEVDWAKDKWKEAVGQAVLYAIWTDRKPAVLLLVKDAEREKVDLLRCRLVCERLGIKMFVEKVTP